MWTSPCGEGLNAKEEEDKGQGMGEQGWMDRHFHMFLQLDGSLACIITCLHHLYK